MLRETIKRDFKNSKFHRVIIKTYGDTTTEIGALGDGTLVHTCQGHQHGENDKTDSL